jgi:hypothetical protein
MRQPRGRLSVEEGRSPEPSFKNVVLMDVLGRSFQTETQSALSNQSKGDKSNWPNNGFLKPVHPLKGHSPKRRWK